MVNKALGTGLFNKRVAGWRPATTAIDLHAMELTASITQHHGHRSTARPGRSFES